MIRSSLSLTLSLLLVAALGPQPAQAGERVAVCHFPPGNPANFHTITVSPAAAAAHVQKHGDVLGDCCAVDAICDDGNACTANFCRDNVCTSQPVDCDDGDPCTIEVGCDPETGCISEPVACNEGEACQPDTGACLPVGQCPCWTGSNPIDALKAAFAAGNPFACVEPASLTCDGMVIELSGSGSGPNGGSASYSTSLSKPSADSCPADPATRALGPCQCPPPPSPCLGFGFGSDSTLLGVDQPNTCIEEFEAACAALQ